METGGIQWFGVELLVEINHSDPAQRRWGITLLKMLFENNSSCDYGPQVPMFLKDLVSHFTDADKEVLLAIKDALAALVSARPNDELMGHLEFTRNMLGSLVSDAKHRKGGAVQP